MNTFFRNHGRKLVLLGILLLAAYMRLWRIADYLTFLGDEGRDVLVVKRMIVDGKLTLLGPTASVGGFFMGPVYYYFMAPFLWLWNLNPVGPAIGVALVGILTVYLVYLLGRRVGGSAYAGFVASLLYALSPVVIRFSRSSWNPNVVPFFSTSLILLLLDIVKKPTAWRFFLIGLILGIGVQMHYVFLFLYPVVLLWLLVHKEQRTYIWGYLRIIAGCLVGLSPMILFELRHDFSNTRGIISFVTAGKDTGFEILRFFPTVASVYERLFARLLFRLPDELQLAQLPQLVRVGWESVGVIASVCMAVYMLFVFWKTKHPEKRDSLGLMLLWCTVAAGFFGLYRKNIYDYYFGIMFAFPFVASAFLADSIRTAGKYGKYVSLGLVAVLALFLWDGRPFKFEPNRQLAQVESIASSVVSHADNKPFNFALISGGNSDHAYRYFFEIWEKSPVTIENKDMDPARKTVTQQLLVVCEQLPCEPLGNSLWEVAGFGRAEIAGVWDVSVVKIYKLVHYKEASPGAQTP